MHLRSVTMKGFKSFPDRTRLDFSPGVSVIVGPNGSGKSNVTEAVLWALGEQSPLAVRGQSMQDVIFAGGHGLPSRQAAEVEVVIEGAEGLGSEFSDLSIVRRLDRGGTGEYRLNGARCRLADVLEVLSDSGLGREMHSVVSQGRVEAIVHSHARERRLLIEEAAGLGKHRRRRRSAELKLRRTEANLARALDVEREARLRLRPLKRQAEAAELHERLEGQQLEARLELLRDDAREASSRADEAGSALAAARAERDRAEAALAGVAKRRQEVEEELAARSAAREDLSRRAFSARSAHERIELRLERARDLERSAREASVRRREELKASEAAGPVDEGVAEPGRVEALEAEVEALEARRAERLEEELADLAARNRELARRRDELSAGLEARRDELSAADRGCEAARAQARGADGRLQAARRHAAETGAELAAVRQYLRTAAPAADGHRTLADELSVDEECRQAVAAALGARLRAPVVDDLAEGERLLDSAGAAGGAALVAGRGARVPPAGERPCAGAEPLLDHVRCEPRVAGLTKRLLAEVWLVDALSSVRADFTGMAVTRSGRLLSGASGELAQAAQGGEDRLLEELGRRDRLAVASQGAAEEVAAAEDEVTAARAAVREADAAREAAEHALRSAARALEEASAVHDAGEREARRRREEPASGPEAVRAAELAAELRAERRLAVELERERARRERRIEALTERIARDDALAVVAGRVAGVLEAARLAVGECHAALEAEWREGEAAGEGTAGRLRALAGEEAELQAALRRATDALTAAELRAQRTSDALSEVEQELSGVASCLGREPGAGGEPLGEEQRGGLEARIQRLTRRREQLGPVNPLAGREYEEAVAHVDELEAQRTDLEGALTELQVLIRDTDRRIREEFERTFDATARNFGEMVTHLFPGGRGRLSLVRPDGPLPVIGGQPADGEAPAEGEGVTEDAEAADDLPQPDAGEPGVEVEVTPAGKATRRLSLLSGGEKSLVALAFLFAVFLARPCPFYILDEVEAALDDANIDRFLQLVRRYSDRAQFIVVTHQRRTMDAADRVYGVSMGSDGVSKVVSRRLSPPLEPSAASEAA